MPVEARNGFPTMGMGQQGPHSPPGVGADADGMGSIHGRDGEELGLEEIYWDNHKAGSS